MNIICVRQTDVYEHDQLSQSSKRCIAKSVSLWGAHMSLTGRSYVVFGAGSGLGQASAAELISRGARVLISDVSTERLEACKDLLGGDCQSACADVASVDQVRSVLAMAVREGTVHGVVNTAGILHGERLVGRSGSHDVAAFEKVIRVNLIGSFNVLAQAAEVMAGNQPSDEGERGVIVNTASIAAFDGQAGQVAYSASKAGVAGMTLPAARDLARHGIRVVAIAPGLFLTPMVAGLSDEARASLERLVPFPSRAGRPEEYASLVCHVLENLMINGETIRIDGGLRMPA